MDHCYLASGGVRSIVMSVSVCLFVCLSVCLSVRSYNAKTTRPTSTDFVLVAYGRGLVLLWQRCDTLCTSSWGMASFFHVIGPNDFMACIR